MVNEDNAVGDVRDALKAELIRLHTTLDEIRDAVGADPDETTMQAIHELAAEWDRARVLVRRLRLAWRSARRAVVLPEPVQRLVDWHLSYDGLNVSPLPFQSEVREAMESWRPVTVEAAPTQRFDLFIGGPKSGTIEPVSEGVPLAETRTGMDWCPRCHEEAGTNRNSHGGVERCAFCWSPLVEHEPSDAAGVSGTGTEASDAQ